MGSIELHHRPRFLFILDLLALAIGAVIGFGVGHISPLSLELIMEYRVGLIALFLATIAIFYILDLYSMNVATDLFRTIYLLFLGLILSAFLGTSFFFFVKRYYFARKVFILFYLSSFAILIIFRYLYAHMLKSKGFAQRVLIIGGGHAAKDLTVLIKDRADLNYHIAGYLSDNPDRYSVEGIPFLGATYDLLDVIRDKEIDKVIVSILRLDELQTGLLLQCLRMKVRISDIKHEYEYITGRVPVEYLDDRWFIEGLTVSIKDKRYYWYAKRAIDILLSSISLLVTLVIFPLIALAIRLDSPGAVLYCQERVGRGLKKFKVYKFRTMVKYADTGDHWTYEKDERITRIGRLLRKIRLDELPQSFNILKGDMSFVGPRPEAVSLVEMYSSAIPYYNERHMVTPGVTGWAQINYRYGNSIEDAREKLKYDFYYIKNRSLMLDLKVLLKTIRIVLTGKGAM